MPVDRRSRSCRASRPSLRADPVDDPAVGLVRHQPVDIGGASAHWRRAPRRPLRSDAAPRGGKPPGPPCADSPVVPGRGRAAIDIEDVVVAAVGMQMGRQHAAAARPRHRAPPCSTTAPAPSPNSTQVPRSCQSRMREKVSAPITSAVRACPSRSALSAVASAKMKPGAHRLDIERGAAVHAELRLHLGRGRREGVVGRRGRQHDQIEIAAAHAGRCERALRRRGRRDRRSARRRPRCGARRCRCAGRSIRRRYRAGRRARHW